MSSPRNSRGGKTKVLLNVYDLLEANKWGYSFGIGAFHSGVQLGEIEYAFGGHEFDFSGIFTVEPRVTPGVVFRESIELGETNLNSREIQALADSLAPKYFGNTYNLFTKNCNHFSDEFCKKLLNKSIPNYVNRMAWVGSFFPCLMPQNMGVPTAQVQEETESIQSYSAFSGSGVKLQENAPLVENMDEDASSKREKMLVAASRRLNTGSSNNL